jgi:uncharacterized protein (DUF1786 family)
MSSVDYSQSVASTRQIAIHMRDGEIVTLAEPAARAILDRLQERYDFFGSLALAANLETGLRSADASPAIEVTKTEEMALRAALDELGLDGY